MFDSFFSDRECGERLRENEIISVSVWKGINSEIGRLVKNGSFAKDFPLYCDDQPNKPIGTDSKEFYDSLYGFIPQLSKPDDGVPWHDVGDSRLPDTYAILDAVEFCWGKVANPKRDENLHSFFSHYHILEFDVKEGRRLFCEAVNKIFRRNGLVYELTSSGKVERVLKPTIRKLVSKNFATGDSTLDEMLEKAQKKFLDPNPDTQSDAIKELWDAWERLKTLRGRDKKSGVQSMLDDAASPDLSPIFREHLECVAKKLTKVGNDLQIRHSETDKEKVEKTSHKEYLFHQLIALINLIIEGQKQKNDSA